MPSLCKYFYVIILYFYRLFFHVTFHNIQDCFSTCLWNRSAVLFIFCGRIFQSILKTELLLQGSFILLLVCKWQTCRKRWHVHSIQWWGMKILLLGFVQVAPCSFIRSVTFDRFMILGMLTWKYVQVNVFRSRTITFCSVLKACNAFKSALSL